MHGAEKGKGEKSLRGAIPLSFTDLSLTYD